MTPRYGLLLLGLLMAPFALAQQVDTIIVRRLPGAPHLFRSLPPGAGIDEKMIIRPGDDEVVYFIRRHGGGSDTVHAYIRLLPERHGFRLHADSLRLHADSLLSRVRPFSSDTTGQLFGRFEEDSLAHFRLWADSLRTNARHLFRLHTDSLRIEGPARWLERPYPGARIEFEGQGDVEVFEDGDSTVVRLHRSPGEALRRFVVPRMERLRPETRADGVLVVPDGRGGTWVYLPPEKEE